MEQMQEYYVLEEKAAEYGIALTEEETKAIEDAAAAFLTDNDENTDNKCCCNASNASDIYP